MRTLQEIDRDLAQARQDMDRANKLDAVIADLTQQQSQRRAAADLARDVLYRELGDVEALERMSFSTFVAKLRGSHKEQLDQERREAAAAKARYDAAKRDLEDLEYRLSSARRERTALTNCASRYQALLKEKEELLLQPGSPNAARLTQLSQELDQLNHQYHEMDEAILAGRTALSELRQMTASLDSAAGLGTWDMLGGGMLVTMAKHQRLEEAQQTARRVRQALSRFRTEMADVSTIQVPDLGLGDFSTFADYFFDGLFADLYVQGKINTAQQSVSATVSQIEQLTGQLARQQGQLSARKTALEEEREGLLTTH